MKRLLLILMLAVVVGGTATPILRSVLGFGPVAAYAGSHVEDDQGEDNDDQGEDEQ